VPKERLEVASRRKLALGVVASTFLLGLIGYLGYLVLLYCIPCRIVAVVLAGRSGQCNIEQSLAAYRQENLRIIPNPRKPRLIREEADGCQLWDSGRGRIWTPRAGGQWIGRIRSSRYRVLDVTGEALVHPGDVVLDCGAYTGGSAREALALGARQVISIEPSPRNLACLLRNMEKQINNGQVIVVGKGVWDREDVLYLQEHPLVAAADYIADVHRAAPKDEGVEVPLTTIDQLVEDLQLERVDFIKMDIEGSEQRAILGARNTIAKYKPRLAIAAYHLPSDNERIPALVKEIWPEYQVEPNRCILKGWGIWPEMFYFH
jgi:FkbM family methyltransferase